MKGWHLRLAYRRIGAQFTLTFPHWAIGMHAEVVPDHSSIRVHFSTTLIAELEVQVYWTRAYKAPAGRPAECGACNGRNLQETIGQRIDEGGYQCNYKYHQCESCGNVEVLAEDVQFNTKELERIEKLRRREQSWWYRAWRKVAG